MPNSKTDRLSKSIEDYLKTVWLRSQEGPVTTGNVATALGVTDASVSNMLCKLGDLGLVRYTPYHGAQLTQAGEHQALRLVRRHRLIETFLIEYLGFGWDEVHVEAEALEHAVSDGFAERLAVKLGHPSHDPHGDPIPTADGLLPNTPDVPLADLDPGQSLEVARLRTQEADVLAYLASLGVQLGHILLVTCQEPLGGLVQFETAGREAAVSKTLATLIRGRLL